MSVGASVGTSTLPDSLSGVTLSGPGLTESGRLAPARPSVIQLHIKEKAALYAAYITQFADGGLFIPTTRSYGLGESIYVLVTLPDSPQRYAVAGKVAWVTPAHASGQRLQGVGVRFPQDTHSVQLKLRIEQLLTGFAGAERTIQTM